MSCRCELCCWAGVVGDVTCDVWMRNRSRRCAVLLVFCWCCCCFYLWRQPGPPAGARARKKGGRRSGRRARARRAWGAGPRERGEERGEERPDPENGPPPQNTPPGGRARPFKARRRQPGPPAAETSELDRQALLASARTCLPVKLYHPGTLSVSMARRRHRGPRRPRPPGPTGAVPTAQSQVTSTPNSEPAVRSAPAAAPPPPPASGPPPSCSLLLRQWLHVPESASDDDDDDDWPDSPPPEPAPEARPTAAAAPRPRSPPPGAVPGGGANPSHPPSRPFRLPPRLALRLRVTAEHLARLRLRRAGGEGAPEPPATPATPATPARVRFSPHVRVRHLVVWASAARLARRGSWARERADRARFRRRVAEAEAFIGPCLGPEARARALARGAGPANSV